MAFWFFSMASALALGGLIFHVVVGQRGYVNPLLASKLPTPLPELSHMSWHITTIQFFSFALAMGYLALQPEAAGAMELAVMVAFICVCTAALFVMLAAARGYGILLRLPGAYLSAAIALLAIAGIYSG